MGTVATSHANIMLYARVVGMHASTLLLASFSYDVTHSLWKLCYGHGKRYHEVGTTPSGKTSATSSAPACSCMARAQQHCISSLV